MSLSGSCIIPHRIKKLHQCPASHLVYHIPHVAQVGLQFGGEQSLSWLFRLGFCPSLNQSLKQKEWDRLTDLSKVVPTISGIRLESILPKVHGCYTIFQRKVWGHQELARAAWILGGQLCRSDNVISIFSMTQWKADEYNLHVRNNSLPLNI